MLPPYCIFHLFFCSRLECISQQTNLCRWLPINWAVRLIFIPRIWMPLNSSCKRHSLMILWFLIHVMTLYESNLTIQFLASVLLPCIVRAFLIAKTLATFYSLILVEEDKTQKKYFFHFHCILYFFRLCLVKLIFIIYVNQKKPKRCLLNTPLNSKNPLQKKYKQ